MATWTQKASDQRPIAALCAFGALLFYFGERALLPDLGGSVSWYMVVLRDGSLVAVSLLSAFAAMRLVPIRPSRLGLRRPDAETLMWGVACAAATMVAGAFSVAILMALDLSPANSSLHVLSHRSPLLVAGHVGATALSQELLFRGTFIALFMTLFKSRWIAAGLSLLMFLLGDARMLDPAEYILMLAPGIVLTAFFWWKRDIFVCIIGHAGARMLAILIVEAMSRLK